MNTGDDIFRLLGQVIAYGGGGAAVAYMLFQFLGKSWIENKFAQRLNDLRHAQELELQRLRVEIDSTLSAVIKIQEKEFETLPEAWERLDEAYARVSHLVAPFQEYPDLDRLVKQRLEEWLAESELFDSEKDEIRNSSTKTTTYREMIFWHRLTKVRKAVSELHNYVERRSIFLPPELKEDFQKVSNELWSAIASKQVGHEAKDYKLQNEGWTTVKNEVEPLRKAIESAIYARLHARGQPKAGAG